MTKILVVEDDKTLATTVSDWLKYEHYLVEVVPSGQAALDRLGTSQYDVIVLDLALPGIGGIEVLRQYRARGGATPVLILTGKGELDEKEQGFEAGADDYLTKPCHLRELSARVKALLRRPKLVVGNTLKAGELELDPNAFKVMRNGVEVQLARMEFALLEFLMRHPGQVFSPEALLERVWQSESERSPESIRTLIKKLRKKIDAPDGESHIENVHGVGYRLK